MDLSKESFTDRLKRTIYCVNVKDKDFWFSISFTSIEEARKYQVMYPNKKMLINASYLYDNAEEAIKPQNLSVVVKD